MKLKKLTALLLAGLMALSLVACGGDADTNTDASTPATGDVAASTDVATGEAAPAELSGELVVWTLAADLEQFSARFMELNPNVTVETVVIAPDDYPTKVETALLGNDSSVDIIVGEPQMLESMFDAGFFEDLNQAPYNAQDYAGKRRSLGSRTAFQVSSSQEAAAFLTVVWWIQVMTPVTLTAVEVARTTV